MTINIINNSHVVWFCSFVWSFQPLKPWHLFVTNKLHQICAHRPLHGKKTKRPRTSPRHNLYSSYPREFLLIITREAGVDSAPAARLSGGANGHRSLSVETINQIQNGVRVVSWEGRSATVLYSPWLDGDVTPSPDSFPRDERATRAAFLGERGAAPVFRNLRCWEDSGGGFVNVAREVRGDCLLWD